MKDLSVSFPELVRASDALPLDTVIDGEIVIADADGSSDFTRAIWTATQHQTCIRTTH
jgi:ATP-dependent DNA ligase